MSPRAQDVPQALSKAILLASAAPAGPVNISLPLDDWNQEADVSALGRPTSRAVDGDPVVPDQSLSPLRDRLASAANPVMVAGPGIDTEAGWEGAIRLAEKLAMPVLVSPMPARCPFPTRHPNFRGILPEDIPGVAGRFTGHDLVVAFGAAIFRYREFTAESDYLPDGAELWAVTADPDQAARAPFGRILIGDPADALGRLAADMAATTRPPLSAGAPPSPADTDGPAFTAEAMLDAVDAAKSDTTVIVNELSSTAIKWDRFDFTRPGSMYFPAAGSLGWGLPAAIGLQLGDPSRRVLALLGDGTVHYTVSALWTAAQHNIPVVFVVARNSEYATLKGLARQMHAPDVPGMELSGMDIPTIATAYGIESARVESLSDLTSAVKHALASDQPRLIEVTERRLADS
jgi:benzoylformate decarboxylase